MKESTKGFFIIGALIIAAIAVIILFPIPSIAAFIVGLVCSFVIPKKKDDKTDKKD